VSRKSRVEADNHHSESPGEASEENPFHGRLSDLSGLTDMVPTSPSQASVDLDQGQHMPHLLCSYWQVRLGEIPG
jgi:hypothetical protein